MGCFYYIHNNSLSVFDVQIRSTITVKSIFRIFLYIWLISSLIDYLHLCFKGQMFMKKFH